MPRTKKTEEVKAPEAPAAETPSVENPNDEGENPNDEGENPNDGGESETSDSTLDEEKQEDPQQDDDLKVVLPGKLVLDESVEPAKIVINLVNVKIIDLRFAKNGQLYRLEDFRAGDVYMLKPCAE